MVARAAMSRPPARIRPIGHQALLALPGLLVVAIGGGVAVIGYTHSDNYPVTPGAFQGAKAEGADAFVARYDSAGGVLWSTFFGAGTSPSQPNYDAGYAVAFDGDTIWAFAPEHNVYAKTEQIGDLDDAIDFAVSELRMKAPMSPQRPSRTRSPR